MKYICCWSGGKDSTASIILAHLHKKPLDIIVFAEVMYDLKRDISGENPDHIKFVKEVAKPIFESWGYEVRIVRSKRDYLSVFNHVVEKPIKHMENKGKRTGFVMSGRCAVKRDCKEKPIYDFYKTLDEEYIQYVGICSDEPKRLQSLSKNKKAISLLAEYNYTQEMARKLCREYNLLSPSYDLSKRGGCWFCPNAKIEEHIKLKEDNPELWSEFLNLENETNLINYKWNVYGTTLKQRDEQIMRLGKQLSFYN